MGDTIVQTRIERRAVGLNNRYDLNQPRRKPLRLKGYDYSRAGAYFITVVVQGRLCLFGDVVGGEMGLNDAGKMVRRVWDGMPDRFSFIEMDEFVVMPNHVHGVIIIHQPPASDVPPVGASRVGALDDPRLHYDTRATTRVAPTLGDVVGALKSLTTVEYGRGVRETGWSPFDKRLWQRNYYERIIRNESELGLAREYIANNPMKWAFDHENPSAGASLAGTLNDIHPHNDKRATTRVAPTDPVEQRHTPTTIHPTHRGVSCGRPRSGV